ncbi:MAG: hypothetical protein HY584_04470 [Candidatus Omnitrophica bacterium]|nr:hypothetical protein [Candidatus Omnitrophota bacterium]
MRTSVKFLVISAFFFFCALADDTSATFFGEVKTGLQNVASDRYGYSLFVPGEYTPDRSWPLVVVLHDTGGRGEEYIKVWAEAAKERGMIVFSPTYEEPRGGLPFDHDQRLIRLKRAIQDQYEVDPDRVLITGFGSGGHYAFYLGLRYPKEFTAIASIGNAVMGNLKKLFSFSYAELNQLPILMLVEQEKEITDSQETLAELDALQARGYFVEMVEAEGTSDLKNPNTNSYILEWFEQISSERETGLNKRSFSIKQEFYEWIDNLLQNR